MKENDFYKEMINVLKAGFYGIGSLGFLVGLASGLYLSEKDLYKKIKDDILENAKKNFPFMK